MHMKYIGIVGVVAVLVAAFAYFTLFTTPAHDRNAELSNVDVSTSATNESISVPATTTILSTGTGTLAEIKAWGADVECTVSYRPSDTEPVVEGTYFVSGESMRGDFLTETPELAEPVLSSMIVQDESVYVWSEIDGELYGVKMDVTAVQDPAVDTREPIALDAEVAYDCTPWEAVDPTIFEPPSDVLFQDLSELLEAGMEYGTAYEGDLPPMQ